MTDSAKQIIPEDIRHDPGIQRMLERMPDSVQKSFNDEQLMHIRNAIGARNWGNHKIDCRGVITFPMLGWRYYFVFLFGKNRRHLTGKEKRIANGLGTLIAAGLLTVVVLFVLVILYLLKSALGIDIFPGFSFGLWTWFKANVLSGPVF
ncbi:hypothetical protein [Vibrio salinus]|uniref:hypothetical protein n=1 Tax=Vibrio salinus TaxID=2899784 RepID=UPI001E31433B|nr:hypothetical protein [Vibrio salinus]MCE0495362.1 hypothetical protein [Vibrio salinus]